LFHQLRYRAEGAADYYAPCQGLRGRRLEERLAAIHARHGLQAVPPEVGPLLQEAGGTTAGLTDLARGLCQLLGPGGSLALALPAAGGELRPSPGSPEPFTPALVRYRYQLPTGGLSGCAWSCRTSPGTSAWAPAPRDPCAPCSPDSSAARPRGSCTP